MVEPKLLNCMPLVEVKKTKVLQIILKKLIKIVLDPPN